MATITVETIEKLNIVSVLAGLKQQTVAEAALAAQSKALGVTKQQLVKVITAQEKATKQATAAINAEQDEVEAIRQKWIAATAAERGYETATANVGTASKHLSGGLTNLSFQINDVVTGLASGQKPMQIFAQQGGQIFQAFQQTPGLLAGVASGLGTVGAGVAALAAPLGSVLIPLMYDYQDAAEAAADGQKALNTALEDAEPLYDRAIGDLRKVRELADASLTVDEKKAKATKAYMEDLTAANAALQESIDTDQAWLATNSANIAGWKEKSDNVKNATKELRDNLVRTEAGIEAAHLLIDIEAEEEIADRKLAASKKALADARKREAQALRERLALDETERIAAKNREQMAQEEDARNKATLQAVIDAENRKLEAANKRAQAVMDLEANLARVQREGYEQAGQFAADYVKSAGGMFEVLYEQKARLAEKGDQEAAQSAVKLFEINRIASLSEAAINTLVAVSKASTSAPPPYNLIPMGVAAAQGAVTVGSILAEPTPTFNDTPGVQQMRGTGPTPVTLAPDDFFAASKSRDGLLAQILDAVSTPRGGSPMGRRPEAGNILSYDPVRLLSRDLPRIVRGGMN